MSIKAFASFASNINSDMHLSDERCFELYFGKEDVYCKTYLTRDDKHIVADFHVRDISGMASAARQALVRHLLLANGVLIKNGDFRVFVDSRRAIT